MATEVLHKNSERYMRQGTFWKYYWRFNWGEDPRRPWYRRCWITTTINNSQHEEWFSLKRIRWPDVDASAWQILLGPIYFSWSRIRD